MIALLETREIYRFAPFAVTDFAAGQISPPRSLLIMFIADRLKRGVIK
ncbi:MAG: hypothetical protein LBU73_08135 [Helicobacteraceae bacterium]|nr:hypothetical protein [Helicobacteraceae bacterium]